MNEVRYFGNKVERKIIKSIYKDKNFQDFEVFQYRGKVLKDYKDVI